MTTPISNDKILPSDGARASVTEKKTAEKSGARQPGQDSLATTSPNTTAVETSSVDVERANQIYSQKQAQFASLKDPISNQEQARILATDIGKQIGADALQAFKAQAGSVSMNISALLETAPA